MSDDLINRLRDIQGQAGLFASAAADRIEELEAKLAKVVAALDTIRTASEFHAQAGISGDVMRYAHECTFRLSDATLELTGENDDH